MTDGVEELNRALEKLHVDSQLQEEPLALSRREMAVVFGFLVQVQATTEHIQRLLDEPEFRTPLNLQAVRTRIDRLLRILEETPVFEAIYGDRIGEIRVILVKAQVTSPFEVGGIAKLLEDFKELSRIVETPSGLS